MRERTIRRRRRTRGALLVSVLLLVAVLAGTEVLVQLKPEVDTAQLRVEGLPPRAASAAEPRTCLRGVDASGIEEIREELGPSERVSSDQIFACPQAFDGLTVTFAGEVIGDLLDRDGGVWVQVNDDAYALEVGPQARHGDHRGFNTGLPVWLPDGMHEQITGLGGPDVRGDVLLIEGTLLRTDPADGGSTTLRAERATIVEPAVELPEPFHAVQAIVAAVLGVVTLVALEWSRRVKKR
ncbi:MAG: hypothetical protein WEB09_06390 [Nitriliruptor sp.]